MLMAKHIKHTMHEMFSEMISLQFSMLALYCATRFQGDYLGLIYLVVASKQPHAICEGAFLWH